MGVGFVSHTIGVCLVSFRIGRAAISFLSVFISDDDCGYVFGADLEEVGFSGALFRSFSSSELLLLLLSLSSFSVIFSVECSVGCSSWL